MKKPQKLAKCVQIPFSARAGGRSARLPPWPVNRKPLPLRVPGALHAETEMDPGPLEMAGPRLAPSPPPPAPCSQTSSCPGSSGSVPEEKQSHHVNEAQETAGAGKGPAPGRRSPGPTGETTCGSDRDSRCLNPGIELTPREDKTCMLAVSDFGIPASAERMPGMRGPLPGFHRSPDGAAAGAGGCAPGQGRPQPASWADAFWVSGSPRPQQVRRHPGIPRFALKSPQVAA